MTPGVHIMPDGPRISGRTCSGGGYLQRSGVQGRHEDWRCRPDSPH